MHIGHVRDVLDLIHVVIGSVIVSECIACLQQVVLKLGAFFKQSNRLYQEYWELCCTSGDIEATRCLKVALEMWDCLTELVEIHIRGNTKIGKLDSFLCGKKQTGALCSRHAHLQCCNQLQRLNRNLRVDRSCFCSTLRLL